VISGQHRSGLPDLLLDRSLGSIAVPALLHAAGLRVHRLVDVYGSAADTVEDPEWLGYAGRHGWPVLMRDQRIRYRPVERAAMIAQGVTVFCLTGGNLEATGMAEHVLKVLDEMAVACARPGPALHLISASGMRTVPLDS
jgi:hypothetical protein